MFPNFQTTNCLAYVPVTPGNKRVNILIKEKDTKIFQMLLWDLLSVHLLAFYGGNILRFSTLETFKISTF